MRRGRDAKVVTNDAGEIYAIDLGSDSCAEHEWGVERLRSRMGLEGAARDGLGYHSAKVSGKDWLLNFKSKGNHIIVFDEGLAWDIRSGGESLKKQKSYYADGHRELYLSKPWRKEDAPETLATAWCESAFSLIIGEAADEKTKAFVEKLGDAISKGDFSVWFGGTGNPFKNSGLVVAITSLVPQDVKDYMVQAYIDQARLEQADVETGVKQLLKEKGKKYYACSARWKDTNKTEVQYWLNPQEQQSHNYGWFTAQELIDWANGIPGNKIDIVKKSEKIGL